MMRLILAVGLASGCASDPPDLTSLPPILALSPTSLDLGDVGLLYSGSETLSIRNAGKNMLSVTPSFDGPEVFSLDLLEPFTVKPDEEILATVTFTPTEYQEYLGRISFESNDKRHPHWLVPVVGRGVDQPTPDIDIEEQTLEFTTTPENTTVSIAFPIVNLGNAPLNLGVSSLQGDSAFTFSAPTEVVVAPGASVAALVTYTNGSPDGHSAILTIPSDDPDEPTTSVVFLGNGGGDYDRPVAAVDCPNNVLLAGPQWLALSGAASTDPEGAALTYDWEVLTRPVASAGVPLSPDNTEDVDLYVDVVGEWSVQLVVKNLLDTKSEPTVCTFSAYPEDDIHVELSWDTPSADLDLHLAQGGNALFDVPEDCSYCNKNPDWGTYSNDDDDPRLDIDDLGGYGPENINLLVPQPDDYIVRVHYFAKNGDEIVYATTKIWLGGDEVLDETRAMVQGEVWEVATIVWPAASIVNTGSANYEADPPTCPD